ncbi:hypothetical protein DIE14_00270 [Burkholderia sp. Bp9017]|nr:MULTISPECIES: hypothetical protein [Burkholderia]MBY4869157.1 hypothetical protein [Burkholderia anthina]RQZ31400.1 hypothetical protein DIE14_00270 [Burkholderia sp. Bp9017]RQZ37532.1 hypothetical protein DIE13_00260 [Burkholderia sp. Bp9016]
MNRGIENDADTTIVRELAQLIGGAAAHVLNAFACIAPALASNPQQVAAREAGRHDAGVA